MPGARSNQSSAVRSRARRYNWRKDTRREDAQASTCCDAHPSNRSESLWTWRWRCVRVRLEFRSLSSLHVANAGDAADGTHHAFQLFLVSDFDGHVDYGAVASAFVVGRGFQAANVALLIE